MTYPARESTDDESELSEHVVMGTPPRPGNHKEVHYHNGNGSQKLVWTLAMGASALVCAIIGTVAMYFASQQATTNQHVADAITNQSSSIAELKANTAAMQRSLDRLERVMDSRP